MRAVAHCTPVTVFLTAALAARSTVVPAQPREGTHHGVPEPTAVPPVAVHHLVIAPGDPVDTLDPTVAPALVFTLDGALMVTRDHDGSLALATLDAGLHRVGIPRVLAAPVGPFAVSPGPPARDGAAVLYTDHGRELVLAVVGPTGEARNIPRRLARADATVSSVALVPTEGGWAAAWATADAGVFVTWLDALGIPRVPPRRVTDGGLPRLSWLPGVRETVLVVSPAGATLEPTALWFTATGESTTRARWPAGALGPMESPGGASTVQLLPTGLPALVRTTANGPTAVEGEAPAGVSLTAWSPLGASVAVVLSDSHGARQSVACVPAEGPGNLTVGATTVLRTGATTPASLAVRGDGEVFVVARENTGHGPPRLGAAQVTCRR